MLAEGDLPEVGQGLLLSKAGQVGLKQGMTPIASEVHADAHATDTVQETTLRDEWRRPILQCLLVPTGFGHILNCDNRFVATLYHWIVGGFGAHETQSWRSQAAVCTADHSCMPEMTLTRSVNQARF